MKVSTGRIPSLLAWGLLVGGISLLITFPEINTDDGLFLGAVPAALLFILGGLVFGLSHPGGRDWAGALLLGWVPAVVGGLSAVTGTGATGALSPVVLILVPGLLSAAGAATGAGLARWRARSA
jgi:hypothetical protein